MRNAIFRKLRTLAGPEDSAALATWWFLRGLGLVFLIAIVSFWVQLDGLVGERGIAPAAPFFAAVEKQVGTARWWMLPTLSWLAPTTAALHWICGVGVFLSVCLLLNLAPALALTGLWAIYLSLCTAGQVFYQFQWDILLLECAILGVFLAPWRLWPGWRAAHAPPRLALWAVWLLLAKLMIQSGVVKLTSGDATWRDLTALTFHFESQPLPLWTSWYAHQLPLWWQKLSCAAMFVIEIGAPLLLVFGARSRLLAALALAALQLLIAATGNYTFFNLLSLILCLPLLHNRHFPGWAAKWLRQTPAGESGWRERLRLGAFAPLGLLLLLLLPGQVLDALSPKTRPALPAWLTSLRAALGPFRSVNSYGLFRVMTKERHEVVFEGTLDGRKWEAYELPYQPGDPARRPRLVAPHQPRLDWQMWFAALGRPEHNPWIGGVLQRLLEAEPTVLALLRRDPLAGERPRQIRAAFFRYRFTTAAERAQSGEWWSREFVGYYVPEVGLTR